MQCPVNQAVAIQLKNNVRMPGELDLKNEAERWAGRCFMDDSPAVRDAAEGCDRHRCLKTFSRPGLAFGR